MRAQFGALTECLIGLRLRANRHRNVRDSGAAASGLLSPRQRERRVDAVATCSDLRLRTCRRRNRAATIDDRHRRDATSRHRRDL